MKAGEGGPSSFWALREIAAQTQARSESITVEQDLQAQWTGIGFRLLGVNWVAPMAQITEILERPSITPLPNVKPWVLGVANVRGRLLPIVNLALFFNKQLVNPKKTHRILVLESEDLYVGLVVDQSYGIQHFKVEDYYDESTLGFVKDKNCLTDFEMKFLDGLYQEDLDLKGCTKGLYLKSNQCWFVMSMLNFIVTEKFSLVSKEVV